MLGRKGLMGGQWLKAQASLTPALSRREKEPILVEFKS